MLQLAQRYAMLTQNKIITDVCQRECQGLKDTTSLNAITGPTCDPHQWAQEPFQLRTVSPVLGWVVLWAALGPGPVLRCSWPFDHTCQIDVGPDSSAGAGLGMSGLWQSLSPWLVLPLPPPADPQRGRSLASPSAMTTFSPQMIKKKFRKCNDQVTPEQHNEYRLLHVLASKAKSRDEAVTLKHWIKHYQAGTETANWKIRSSPRPCNQASLGQHDNTDFIPLRGKTCRLDAGGSPAGLIIQWWP